jgi:hypothetical protein
MRIRPCAQLQRRDSNGKLLWPLISSTWLDGGIAADELQSLRQHLQQERAWGSPRFQAMVEETLQRPAQCRSRGRPRKPPEENGG